MSERVSLKQYDLDNYVRNVKFDITELANKLDELESQYATGIKVGLIIARDFMDQVRRNWKFEESEDV